MTHCPGVCMAELSGREGIYRPLKSKTDDGGRKVGELRRVGRERIKRGKEVGGMKSREEGRE